MLPHGLLDLAAVSSAGSTASLALRQSYCGFTCLLRPKRALGQPGSSPLFLTFPLAFLPWLSSFFPVDLFLWLLALVYLCPFALHAGFWLGMPHCNLVQRPLGFPLRSVTSFPWPRVYHYYGLICHPAPLRPVLVFPLVRSYLFFLGRYRASPVKSACLNLNASVLT